MATTVDADELRGCIHSETIAAMMASGVTSRVVARDDPVGEAAGDLAHLGPLPLISVAAGAETTVSVRSAISQAAASTASSPSGVWA